MEAEHTSRSALLTSLIQATLIVLVGAVLGTASNSFRSDRLPWAGEPPRPRVEAAAPSIEIMDAWRQYQKGLVQFVDARTPSEFASGHLPGAVSVPVEEAEGKGGAVKLPEGKTLVIYCSDPQCPKSAQLAALLSRQGVKGIRVMPGGWAGWFEAGLPFEGEGAQ